MAIGTLSIYSKGYVRRAVHESSNTLTVSVLLLSCTALLTYRSEEHTSELQSRLHLVCRLLLEKKKTDAPQRLYQTGLGRLLLRIHTHSTSGINAPRLFPHVDTLGALFLRVYVV